MTESSTSSAWAPLHNAIFRALWIGGLVSNIGTWMHEVGESWLMTALSPSPLVVATLNGMDSFAVFLLAIPAGALADVVDRRRLALFAQAWLLLFATALGAGVLLGVMTPMLLSMLTFGMGVGAAMSGPAWQAMMPESVARKDLAAAVTLGGASMNVARAVGPALGGLVVAAVGPAAVFFVNALSFAFVIIVLLRARRPHAPSTLPAERWLSAMKAGLRFLRSSPELRVVLLRAGTTLLCATSLLALLPSLARRDLGVGSAQYGVFVGCMGVGAVGGAAVLPILRNRLSPDSLLSVGVCALAFALFGLSRLHAPAGVAGTMLIAGVAWTMIASGFNVAVQSATPAWIRGRVLSIYLVVFQGATAIGSILWGAVAVRTNVRHALLIAAIALVGGLLLRIRYPLRVSDEDLSHDPYWSDPIVRGAPAPSDGPVLVLVEYRVRAAEHDAFVSAMTSLGRERRRSGAFVWELFRDLAMPGRFVETFLVESWLDHLRQHDRVTVADAQWERRIEATLEEGKPSTTTHFVSVRSSSKGRIVPPLC